MFGETGQPLADTKPVDIKMAYTRALRTTVATDQGPLAVYVTHLGSARVNPRAGFWTDSRDRGAQALGKAIAAEQHERVVLLGDLNGTMDDRAFADLTSQLRSAQNAAGTASASPGRRPSRWRGSTRSWSAAWSRRARGCCRPPAATTCRWRPESAGEHRAAPEPKPAPAYAPQKLLVGYLAPGRPLVNGTPKIQRSRSRQPCRSGTGRLHVTGTVARRRDLVVQDKPVAEQRPSSAHLGPQKGRWTPTAWSDVVERPDESGGDQQVA